MHHTPLKPLILIGAGGHAKVLLSLIQSLEAEIVGVVDPMLAQEGQLRWRGLAILGGDACISSFKPDEVMLVNGIGKRVDDSVRLNIYEHFNQKGYRFAKLIHPHAYVDKDVFLGEGVQVMAGAVIQPGVVVAENTIINTRASLDHDCNISSHVHVAPGAVLCGQVSVAKSAFIGAGAIITQGIAIGEGAVIGAGASIVRNVPPGQKVLPGALRIGLSEYLA